MEAAIFVLTRIGSVDDEFSEKSNVVVKSLKILHRCIEFALEITCFLTQNNTLVALRQTLALFGQWLDDMELDVFNIDVDNNQLRDCFNASACFSDRSFTLSYFF